MDLDALKAAHAEVREQNDKLLLVIAEIAAAGHITVMPSAMMLGDSRPVIMLPQNDYDRMLEIIPNETP